jgi:hypothetical protein
LSVSGVDVSSNDAFTFNKGKAFIDTAHNTATGFGPSFVMGAGNDEVHLTNATVASNTLGFLITGNGGGDSIFLNQQQNRSDHLIYLKATDSQNGGLAPTGTDADNESIDHVSGFNHYDIIRGFQTNGGPIQEDKFDFSKLTIGVHDYSAKTGVTVNGDGTISGAAAANLFDAPTDAYGVVGINGTLTKAGGGIENGTWLFVNTHATTLTEQHTFDPTKDMVIFVGQVNNGQLHDSNFIF